MKFAHMGDCHLGGWRQPKLASLNTQSFAYAIERSIKEKVDFVLIAGDLFDTAYPDIDTIKDAFAQFRKLKEAKIPVFLIAGSHDYSVSGKTFLDVIEKAGMAENAFKPEYKDDKIILEPIIYKGVAIYGYPGKKSGLEVEEIEKIKLQDSPGMFKILMLHTAIRDAVGSLPIPAVDESKLPKVDYLALAHLHVNYNKNSRVYCGPTFPNNSEELEELGGGSFYIIDTQNKIEKVPICLKEIISLRIEIKNALTATDEIITKIKSHDFKDKILILKLHGILEIGKKSDIDFSKIESFAQSEGCYVILKNTSKIFSKELEMKFEVNSENIEADIIKNFQEKHSSKFNSRVESLISALDTEKKEGEITKTFEQRILAESQKVLNYETQISNS